MKAFKIDKTLNYNPDHFSGGVEYQDVEDGVIFEFTATSYTRDGFEREVREVLADPLNRLISYTIEGQRVEIAEPLQREGNQD